MKVHRLLIAALTCAPLLASADTSQPSPAGLWALPKGSPCEMSFRLTSDGRVTRTTAKLEYTTKASLVRDGDGWRLDEKLEKHNGQASCRGEAAEKVVEHLKVPAYIEVTGDTLKYYQSKGSARVLTFVRAGT